MRLSDADRELLFEKLGRHAAAGRLEIEELERRVAAIDAAQTQAQASAVMADLPPLALPAPRRRSRRGRGHGDADAPAPEWQPTNERFRDPRSGRVMRVWVDSAGGRHYVAEG
ncbi:MAG: DUF1707 SHOCT-like domain-containing protein [Solirubrobacteraceae bacterium]